MSCTDKSELLLARHAAKAIRKPTTRDLTTKRSSEGSVQSENVESQSYVSPTFLLGGLRRSVVLMLRSSVDNWVCHSLQGMHPGQMASCPQSVCANTQVLTSSHELAPQFVRHRNCIANEWI